MSIVEFDGPPSWSLGASETGESTKCPWVVAVGLRRGPHESRILAGYSGLNANISLTFQAIKNLYAHPTYLYFGPFCNFFGDF